MNSTGLNGENVSRCTGDGPFSATEVSGRGVALVRSEAIAGVSPVQPPHEAVPVDLRDDGGGSDGGAERVALDNGRARLVPPVQRERVHEYMVRGVVEAFERAAHRHTGGGRDALAIDLLVAGFADAESQSDAAHQLVGAA